MNVITLDLLVIYYNTKHAKFIVLDQVENVGYYLWLSTTKQHKFYQVLIGLIHPRGEQGGLVQMLGTFRRWIMTYHDSSVVSMLNMEFVIIELGPCQNQPSNKNHGLHPNMCNDGSHLPFVLLVSSTPPKFFKTED